jgi:hypothetical protein
MNKFILFIFCALLCSEANAQTVGISSSAFTPNSASILDVSSSTKGVLLPRMTTAERGTYTATSSLGATHKGITIFNTTTSRYDYWDGTQWLQLAAVGASGSDFIQNQVAASQTADFRISGKGIFGNGTAVAPSVTFEGSQTTGLYRSAADVLSISTAGGERVRIGSTGVVRLTNYASGMLGVDASGDVQTRSIAVSATGIDVTNGNGVSGNPTLNLNYANSSTGGPYPQGNFGQFVPSASNPTDFNTTPGYWGWNFVAGTTNAPNATSSQWYRGVFALGSEYPARGANSYSLELAYPRYSGATAGVWMRTVENGAIGSWIRIDAGSNNTNFIWNQNASAQTTGNFWVSGTGRTNGTLTGGGSTVISADNIQVNDLGAGARYAYIDLEGDDTYTDYGLRLMRGNGGVNATSTLTHRGTGDLQIHTNEAAALTFHTTNAERMRIQASGNVGVNSNAPSNRLYVNDVAATMATVNTYQFGLGLSGATNLTLGADASYGLIQTWASKPLLINSQGNNVGIGMTSAPTQRLDVNGGIRSVDYGAAGSVNVMVGDDTYFTDIDVGSMVGLYSTSNTAVGGLRFGSSGGAYLYGATDNIGVGNTAPTHKLHVTGDIWAEGRYVVQNGTDGGSTRGIRMWTATDSNWGIYMGQSGGGRSLSGGTATAGGGFSAHAIRFRVNADATQGFIFENNAESNLMSIRGDNGRTTFRGGVFFDCNDCGSTTTIDGNQNWGDLTIQGRVLSTNSNLHLSPPGGSRVIINSAYRAAGGGGGTTGLDIEDGGIRMRKNYRWINRYGSTGGYGWGSQTHNLGNWDFCAVGHVGFRNTNSATDEDDDVQCAVYPQAHAGPGEGDQWDSWFTYQYNSRPLWFMYLEGYADTNATNCAAMCMNLD